MAVLWSAVIGWFTLQVAEALDLRPSSDGSGVALAGFLEETGKLLPLLALAVLAPGRVRRFSAMDWSLLGFTCGIAFNAYEDAIRHVASRGMLWFLRNPPDPYTLNPWSTAGFSTSDGVAVAHGHHIWTATTAMGIGLGVALWRTGRAPHRVAALVLPISCYLLTVAEHTSYNAYNRDWRWPEEGAEGFPALLSGLWSLTGHGRGVGVLSVVLLAACLLTDSQRRHRAAALAPPGDDRQRPSGAVGDHVPGHRLVARWELGLQRWEGATRRLGELVTPLLRMLTQVWADLAVVVAAHARVGDEPRRLAIGRGRAVAVHVRNIRAEAMAVTTPGAEPRSRRRYRGIALGLGVVGTAVTLWWGMSMAAAIGPNLLVKGDATYLAGLLENAGQWWSGLSPVQQIAVGVGVAAVVALSGGSLALAIGVSGAATYGLAHAAGAATFVRDPVRATADYVRTTTPLEAALDGGEFVLTFLPGNFAGAAAGRGARLLADEIARDPAATWAARRGAFTGDAGVIDLGAFMRREPLEGVNGETWRALDTTQEAAARARYHALEHSHLRARGAAADYQEQVLGTDERWLARWGEDGKQGAVLDGATHAYGSIADAKLVTGSTSFYVPESLSSPKMVEFAQADLDHRIDKILRAMDMAGIDNSTTPFEFVTNDLRAAEFIESRMRARGLQGFVRLEPWRGGP
ncbi:PrsW family glutamic-type intramembrane protease [Cellulomonas phragmiteti]|uniref:PrsW family glutamic-type intramembrane protease n=1 Tax=Cellulomonas phragmiteti TaxID=478780 RepID=UPI0019457F98|nr:PrsW family glutamic-type intramembrane protease [Cellulomonas phragmiteti]